MRKILVAVTGMSPQIVTETIYALNKEQGWVPDEVHVLTTLEGKNKICTHLFNEKQFDNLCFDYDLKNIQFTQEQIHVVHDENGPLSDIQTPAQNASAASQIVRFIHDLCKDENNELHVSIAGGRKSMGFYIGYALSLFGRRQDAMSHVLVSSPFESLKDFFYPSKTEKIIKIADKDYDASKAQVLLAPIPFVRMREGMPMFNLGEDESYLQAVMLTQTALSKFTVLVNTKNKTLTCNNFAVIKLTDQEMSIYSAVAQFSKKNKSVAATAKITEDSCSVVEFIDVYLDCLSLYDKNLRSQASHAKEFYAKKREDLEKDYGNGRAEIVRVLHENSSKITKKLKKQLGDYYQYFKIDSEGPNNNKVYKLMLNPENITFAD